MVREQFEVEPDRWQAAALRLYPKCPRLAMKACTGPGKAIEINTLIDTPVGIRRWGDLQVGDLVFAEDGSPTRITGVFPQGVKNLFRLTFDDGSSSLCCGDHLWKVRGRTERRHFKARKSPDWTPERERRARAQGGYLTPEDGYSVLSTEQIIARGVKLASHNGRNQFEIPRQGPAQFPHARQYSDAYVAGVWIGDGAKGSECYMKPYHEVEDEINARGYETKRDKYDRVRIHNSYLSDLDCFQLGSHERFIPDNYKYASITQRRDLLCGLMDTDGCIGDDGHMEYSTTSERLANDVVWLVRSLGGVALIKAAIKEGWYRGPDGEKVECRDCYRVTVCLPFNPFRIKHKAERWKDPMRSPSSARYLTRFITSIEPAGEADCMCISVEHPSHCYLTNDFIVTHNTAVLAWIAWNFLLTRPHPMIGCASITGDNLKTGLWTELSRWYLKSKLLQSLFEKTGDKIYMREYPDTWRIEARKWAQAADKEAIGNALAGLHAKYVMWLLDETGDYPDAVMPTCEAIFSGEPVEAHIVQAGNPTRRGGPLFRAWSRRNEANRAWEVISITADPNDPDRTPRVSVEHALSQIKEYGIDNPWVRVKIFGEFPDSDFNALISEDELRAAFGRYYRSPPGPRILGVDIADYGDDQSVIFARAGLQAMPAKKYRHVNSIDGASLVSRFWGDFPGVGGVADACFLDASGGYGAGWRDQLIQIGRSPIGIQFGGGAHDKRQFHNKRAEMHWDAVQWIKRGGALCDSEELVKSLTQTNYVMRNDVILLEPKADVKAKIGFSPDESDAFCFVAGTRIALPSGSLPIERVSELDRVLTPFGEARVMKTWAHEVASLTTVKFSDGSILVGAPDHEIFVFGHGKVRLDALSLTMAISPLRERRKWLMLSGLFTKARSIGFKKATDIIPLVSQFSASAFCIGAYGQNITGLFRQTMKCITEMMIGGAVRSAIWNCLVNRNIMRFIRTSAGNMVIGSILCMANADGNSQKNGTHLPKGLLGTARTGEKRGLIEASQRSNVSNAEMSSRHIIPQKRATVRARVISMWRSGHISRNLATVPIVVRNSWRTAIGKPLVVPVSVRTENVPPTLVYNLTLSRDNAFYANGVLVFNCLTFAEPVVPRYQATPIAHHRDREFEPFREPSDGMPSSRDYNPYR
jgi:phage terminase large subunit